MTTKTDYKSIRELSECYDSVYEKGGQITMGRDKPFNIPNILESYRRDVLAGKIALEDAARGLARAGWMMGIVNVEKARELMGLDEKFS